MKLLVLGALMVSLLLLGCTGETKYATAARRSTGRGRTCAARTQIAQNR